MVQLSAVVIFSSFPSIIFHSSSPLLSMSDQLLQRLQKGKTAKEVEEALADLTPEGLSEEEKKDVSGHLQNLLSEESPVNLNSKSRRRIKRFLSSLSSSSGVGSTEGGESSSEITPSTAVDANDPAVEALLQSLPERASSISTANDIDAFVKSIPMSDIHCHSSGVKVVIDCLSDVLKLHESLVNAKLRRSIKRSLDRLSSFSSSCNDTQHNDDVTTSYIEELPPEPVSTAETINLLTTATTFSDVKYAMNTYASIPPPTDGSKEDQLARDNRKNLRQAMIRILSSPNRDELTNKKLRHRMEKAIYLLDPTAPLFKKNKSEQSTHKSAISSSPVKPPDETKLISAKAEAEACEQNPVSVKTFDVQTLLDTLASATNANELLQAVENIPARKEDILHSITTSDDSHKFDVDVATKILCMFQNMLKEDSYTNDKIPNAAPLKIKLIAKAKRKIKRIASALEMAIKDSSILPLGEKEDHSPGSDMDQDSIPAQDLEPVIKALRHSEDVSDLDAILDSIEPVCGTCKSRRTLKRLLYCIFTKSDIGSATKEKIEKVMEYLKPSVTKKAETETISKDSKKRKQNQDEDEDDDDGRNSNSNNIDDHDTTLKAKYRLFVGQMDFNSTAEDLENYLRSQGVSCPINIRMLSDKDTGKSKGAAFVDICGGKRSLKRCMSLHHTMLGGRRINVEKTTKGRSDEVAVKKRRLDLKINESEKVDEVLREYEASAAFEVNLRSLDDSTMNRLYALTMTDVRDILSKHREIRVSDSSNSDSDQSIFKRLIAQKDGGGKAVDQSKARGYGSFNSMRSGFLEQPSGSTEESKSVPRGYSGEASKAGRDEGIAEVFKSVKGRGGKRIGVR